MIYQRRWFRRRWLPARKNLRSILLAGASLFLSGILGLPANLSAAEGVSIWQALNGGDHIVLLRHALAPGTGDPPEFTLGDCSTQRNLSGAGRAQARRIGELFRANGISTARVFTSQWCRCRETADLLGLGTVQDLPALNSFFNDFRQRDPQTRTLKEWLAGQALDRPLVLVTHQVNITAFSGYYPASGELVFMRRAADGTLSVAGTIRTE